MKIAFQKVGMWEEKPHAEGELAFRMLAAAQSIHSVDAIASGDMKEITRFAPDIVVPLHFFIPKLFDAFTVGCMWNPVSAIERNNAWDNVKSYDGYAVASESQEQVVRAIKFRSPEPYLITRLYPSTNSTIFQKPEHFSTPVYVGSNWSSEQQRDFFSLSKSVHVYGPKKSWVQLTDGLYRGDVPVDGKSLLGIYHNSGIGLALHTEDHNNEGIPSMRPFEIAASGAVMISDNNYFVQKEFGDSALYLDTSLKQKEIAEQLVELTKWIQGHPKRAQEMAEACHELFIKKFSLEVLLRNFLEDITQFKDSGHFRIKNDSPRVEIIVRSDGKDIKSLVRALKSISNQAYDKTDALLVYRGSKEGLHSMQYKIKENVPVLNIKYICLNDHKDRSSQFFQGLRASTASFIGFLDHDDVLFSDHVAILIDCLSKYPSACLAYSGSVRVWEGGNPPENEEIRKLAYFYELENTQGLKACITSNSYLVRREKIPWHIFNNPIPAMKSLEDSIFLNMLYKIHPYFIFTEKVSCAFYWRISREDNSAFDKKAWNPSKNIFDLIKLQAGSMMTYGDYATKDAVSFSHLLVGKFANLKKVIVSKIKNKLRK